MHLKKRDLRLSPPFPALLLVGGGLLLPVTLLGGGDSSSERAAASAAWDVPGLAGPLPPLPAARRLPARLPPAEPRLPNSSALLADSAAAALGEPAGEPCCEPPALLVKASLSEPALCRFSFLQLAISWAPVLLLGVPARASAAMPVACLPPTAPALPPFFAAASASGKGASSAKCRFL